MKRYTSLLALVVVAAVLTVGCSSDSSNPMTPDSASNFNNQRSLQNGLASGIPADAIIDSAFAQLYVADADSEAVDVTVHEVTAPWEEGNVTWDGLGENYAAAPSATINVDGTGWVTVDLTTAVNGWFEGSVDNNGVVLQQLDTLAEWTVFNSREATDMQPMLLVYYNSNDSAMVDTVMAYADATIDSVSGANNYGFDSSLYVGRGVETIDEEDFSTRRASALMFALEVQPLPSSLGDMVWLDENANGIQDSGEVGMADITVNLYDCFDTLLATTTTDSGGMYLFDSLMAGDYVIEVILPDGYSFSMADQGDDDIIDSDVDPMTGRTMCISLAEGIDDMSWDAGLYAFNGCTYGKGYWKNHGEEVMDLLPIWLGTDDGDKSLAVTNADTAYLVLQQHTFGEPKNGITKLYAHLLATKLNIANDANPSDISDVVDEADAFLADYGYMDWDMLDKDMQKSVLGWKDMLEKYNEGYIGPGSCDESDCDGYDDDEGDHYDDGGYEDGDHHGDDDGGDHNG